jgi:hypothetical protein
VADKLQREQENPVNLLRDTSIRLLETLKIERERTAAAALTTAATYGSNTTTLSGTDQFSDYTNSNPEDIIE